MNSICSVAFFPSSLAFIYFFGLIIFDYVILLSAGLFSYYLVLKLGVIICILDSL